ncbi:MAG TPA: SIMPL domain-containing protein [Candidatus Dormibacteraeota bacterium]|nr:SIMPL domain-containing protein [Candidatus Dormibacteraeota bacterium]
MQLSLRPLLFAGAIATLCALTVTLAAGANSRPQILIATPTAGPATTSTFNPGVITNGDAIVSKKPDIAFLSVGVESMQPTATVAQRDLADKAAKLIARAKTLGIADKDMSTSGYSVSPNYTEPTGTINGYRASEQLQLKWHDVNTVGKALDALVQEGGATQVGVGFGLADPKAAQAEARSLAIADARSRGQAMATAAGVKLGQVLRVSDLSGSGGSPSYRNFAPAAGATATQVPVGELDIQVTVEVDFAIG